MNEYTHLATLTLALCASATFTMLTTEMWLLQAFSFALTMTYLFLVGEEVAFLHAQNKENTLG